MSSSQNKQCNTAIVEGHSQCHCQLVIISTPSNNTLSINPTRTTPLQYSSMSSNPMSVRASTPSSTRGDSNPNLEVPFHLF